MIRTTFQNAGIFNDDIRLISSKKTLTENNKYIGDRLWILA
jgi:hypothetical protein